MRHVALRGSKWQVYTPIVSHFPTLTLKPIHRAPLTSPSSATQMVKAIMGCITSKTQEKPLVIKVYHRRKKTIRSQDISSCNRFQWMNQSGEKSYLFDIWQPQKVEWLSTLELGGVETGWLLPGTTKVAAVPDLDDSVRKISRDGEIR